MKRGKHALTDVDPGSGVLKTTKHVEDCSERLRIVNQRALGTGEPKVCFLGDSEILVCLQNRSESLSE